MESFFTKFQKDVFEAIVIFSVLVVMLIVFKYVEEWYLDSIRRKNMSPEEKEEKMRILVELEKVNQKITWQKTVFEKCSALYIGETCNVFSQQYMLDQPYIAMQPGFEKKIEEQTVKPAEQQLDKTTNQQANPKSTSHQPLDSVAIDIYSEGEEETKATIVLSDASAFISREVALKDKLSEIVVSVANLEKGRETKKEGIQNQEGYKKTV